MEINFVHRNCEIQIIIDSQFGNKGYAKAFKMAIDYAFLVLNLNKVYLYVDVNNEKQCTYIKSRFHYRRLKEHFYTQGKYKDCYVMGLLKTKWIEQRNGDDDLSQVR